MGTDGDSRDGGDSTVELPTHTLPLRAHHHIPFATNIRGTMRESNGRLLVLRRFPPGIES